VSIPQSFIQELLSRVDVVDVVGRHVQLKKGGANFMGLCPFHGEKSPSFSVSPAKQFYHCFGCGANGNAISFLMEHGGMSFIEAVKDLAQQTGLAVPEDDASPQDRERAKALREQQQSLSDLLEQASKSYQKHLKTSPRAVAYLKGRGLSGEIARAFGLGYAPEGWRALASMLPDYADPRLVEAGLVIAPDTAPAGTQAQPEATTPIPSTLSDAASQPTPRLPTSPTTSSGHEEAGPTGTRAAKRYDRFRDRIMFPIRNVKGETIGFGGRVLDKGEPKYLNSPETPVFSKGRELYGLFEARTAIRVAGYALVTEGYMDVVALAQLGFANAVATLGTACTSEHVQKLFRFTDAVVFSFDGDAAGRRAAGKAMVVALPFAQDTRSIKFLFLPPEHDPDSYIRTHGTDAFAQCVKEAVPLSQFMKDTASARCDLGTAEGRALMASNARPLWQALPDGALKRQLLGELAQQIGLGVPELSDLWKLNHAPAHGRVEFNSKVSNHKKREEHFFPEIDHPFPEAADPQAPSPRNVRPTYKQKKPWTPPTKGWGEAHRREQALRAGTEPPGLSGSIPLNTRVDLVGRIMLSQPESGNWLTAEDHHLLDKQPEPLGAMFRWLESQWHEHGPQPWAVLQQAMAGHEFESKANQLMAQAMSLMTPPIGDAPSTTNDSGDDAQKELREVLSRMLIDDLMARETQALAETAVRPEAVQIYKELYERRIALQKQLQAPLPAQKI